MQEEHQFPIERGDSRDCSTLRKSGGNCWSACGRIASTPRTASAAKAIVRSPVRTVTRRSHRVDRSSNSSAASMTGTGAPLMMHNPRTIGGPRPRDDRSDASRIDPLVGSGPPMVRGLCIIRGAPVPVIDAALLFDERSTRCERLVTVRTGERTIAFAAEAVLGVEAIRPQALQQLPPLLRNVETIAAITTLDRNWCSSCMRHASFRMIFSFVEMPKGRGVNCQVTPFEMQRFRTAVSRQIGLRFDDAKLGFLGEVLQRRLESSAAAARPICGNWNTPAARRNLGAGAELTVGETYFFRNNEQFARLPRSCCPNVSVCNEHPKCCGCCRQAARRVKKPTRWRSSRGKRLQIRPGQWPFAPWTLIRRPWKKPARALFAWALRKRLPISVPSGFVRMAATSFSMTPRARWLQSRPPNLASDDPGIWQPATYDAIFCRNVLMYFEPEQMRATIARIAQSLAPGGFLFLGHAETLRGVSDRFHLRNTHETFYYQLNDGAEPDCERVVRFTPRPSPVRMPHTGRDVAWVDDIRMASERVAALVPLREAAGGSIQKSAPPFDPAPALELLRQERFTEALDHVRAESKPADRNLDALLLEATLLVA